MLKSKIFPKLLFFACALGLCLSVSLFAWVGISHNYRPPFEEQFEAFHDGVALFEVPAGYPESRDKKLDQFDHQLFLDVRSVDDALEYLDENYTINNDLDALHAVFDFTSRRFVHRMYPRHTWKTNPFFALLEWVFPASAINEMSTAGELLRHSAVGGCGDTSVTSITLFRKLGYEAQYVSLDGHHVGEFIAGGKKWFVDADMEVIAPYSIQQIKENLDLVYEIYGDYPKQRQNTMMRIISSKTFSANGYDGAPKYGDRMWNLHRFIEVVKWIIPLIGVLVSLLLFAFYRGVRAVDNPVKA